MEVSQWRIDTPEQVNLSFDVAGIGSRFLALALDMLFQALAFFLLLIALSGAQRAMSAGAASWYTAFVIISAAVIFFVYFILFEGITRGRTPGKMICRLRVIRDDGRPLDWGGNLARNLLRLLDFLPVAYGVGLVSMFVSRDARRVGDIVAGTLVVHTPKVRKASLMELQRAAALPPQNVQVSRFPLKESELSLVRDLLAREKLLDKKSFHALCWQISQPLFDKFLIPPHMRYDCQGFLRMLWEENRVR